MTAIRLARAATGRDVIVKFAGAYHGHFDGLLAQAGSGLVTQGIPSSPGVPASTAAETVVVAWNDRAALEQATAGRDVGGDHRRALPGQHGARPAADGYLALLRAARRCVWRAADPRRG